MRPSKISSALRDHRLDLIGIGDIGGHDLDLPTELAQLVGQRGERVLIAAREHEVRALATHPANAGATDSGRACHDGFLSLESHGLPHPTKSGSPMPFIGLRVPEAPSPPVRRCRALLTQLRKHRAGADAIGIGTKLDDGSTARGCGPFEGGGELIGTGHGFGAHSMRLRERREIGTGEVRGDDAARTV